MAIVLEECITEEQRYDVRFFFVGTNSSIIKEMFPVYGGKCLSRKAGPALVANVSPITKRKWLRQTKDFYAAGFDALVKRWDKCINVG
jgi:hypothetical protein